MMHRSEGEMWGTVQPEAWKVNAHGGPEPVPDAIVEAARDYGLDIEALHDYIEGECGLEVHDAGYGEAVRQHAAILAGTTATEGRRVMGDECRPVEIDGEIIRVHGAAPMTDEDRGFMAEIVRAARAKFAADRHAADQIPDNPTTTTPPALAEVTTEMQESNDE